MTPERQKKIDAHHGYAKQILEVSLCLLLCLGFIMFIPALLSVFGWDITAYTWYAVVVLIYKYIAAVLAIVAVLALIVLFILSIWATDEEEKKRQEEEQRRIEQIEEVLQKHEANKKTQNQPATKAEVRCPLIRVTPEQKDLLERYIKEHMHKHATDSSRFDRKWAFGYLLALQRLRYISLDEDIDNMRAWLEDVTELYEPTSEARAHFKNDFKKRAETSTSVQLVKTIENLMKNCDKRDIAVADLEK